MQSRRSRFLVVLWLLGSVACGSSGAGDPSMRPDGGEDATEDGSPTDAPSESDAGGGTDAADEADSDLDAGPCEVALEGLYAISGADSLGAYAGQAEISAGRFVRAIRYESYRADDGAEVAQVFEGELESGAGGVHVTAALDRVGFVTAVGSWTRDGMSKAPAVEVAGTLTPAGCNRYEGVLQGTDAFGALSLEDRWERIGPRGASPIWVNERQEILTADAANSTWLAQFFSPAEYAASPRIAPYAAYPEFQTGIAIAVFDATDFDFYRAPENANVYRVIQQVVDPISIVEASLRATAYRYRLADKEAFFSGDAPRAGDVQHKSINELGLMAHWSDVHQDYLHDGDGLLWTGVYVAAMAMKFMQTGDETARVQMLTSLDGVIKCLEVTGTGTEFARTIRPYIEARTYDVGDPSEWVRGTGTFSSIEWKVHGNNDMSKGFLTAYLWASLALHVMSPSQLAETTATYGDLYQRMFDTLSALRDQHELYSWSTTNPMNLPAWYDANTTLAVIASRSPAIADDAVSINPVHWTLLKQTYDQEELGFLNENGVSDWSGNHLGILGRLNLWTSFSVLGLTGNASDLAGFIGDANTKMKRHRLGFLQVVAGTLGSPADPANVQDGIWALREMSIPKTSYLIDWEQNPGYCMSPNPELPWKVDWKTSDRTQSIRAYPLFERPPSSYAWKDNPYRQYFGQGDPAWSGIDFLIAYWFARGRGIIDANE